MATTAAPDEEDEISISISLPPQPPEAPDRALELVLTALLPFLLLACSSARFFPGKWRQLRPKLAQLQAALQDPVLSHPLFPDLLPALYSTLLSLRSLSFRCNDASLHGGKLLLQSDLDIASSSLSLHLHDLQLLLRSGLHAAATGASSSAIVLSFPTSTSSKEDLTIFIRDLFARLLIGTLDLKKKALDSLLRLLKDSDDDPKMAALVAEEGDVSCLVHLLDPSNHSLIREQAAAVVAVLSTASDRSRQALFDEGVLGPLLRLLDSGSALAKEKAAAAIDAITADPGNSWAVPAYCGISILIEACRSGGSPVTQAKASGSLKNIASAVGDARETMVEEDAIPVLVKMLSSGNGTCEEAQRNAAHCLWIVASGGEEIRASILQEGALLKLLHLMLESSSSTDSELLEHVLRSLLALSSSSTAARSLTSSQPFIAQLSDLISHGSTAMQQISAGLLGNLSLGEDGKRSMAGCMSALLKLMDSTKAADAQEVAAKALVSLLAVRSNRKELSRDEKSISRLVQMLDPSIGEATLKRFPISVVLALTAGSPGGAGGGCRKRIAAAGACQQLQKLADLDVIGAKKALQRISGGRLKNLLSSISWS